MLVPMLTEVTWRIAVMTGPNTSVALSAAAVDSGGVVSAVVEGAVLDVVGMSVGGTVLVVEGMVQPIDKVMMLRQITMKTSLCFT
jgi:hypothetical protein